MKHFNTKRLMTFLAFILLWSLPGFTQVNFSANDFITPYEGHFRPGSNLGFLPVGWSNQSAADLLAGDPAQGIPGVGAQSLRPSLASYVLEDLGDEIELESFEHYFSIGIEDLTAFVGEPSDALRDHTEYCPGHESTMFKNLYEPIWDNGENGTPVNDNNPFALYMYRIVTKYNNYVKFWEIWNEPGFVYTDKGWRPPGYPGNFWEYNPDPCDYKLRAPIFHYLRTLRISYEVIKYVAPEDYVVVAGLGYPSFLDVILRNTDNPNNGAVTGDFPLKGGAYFDVLGIHSYPSIDGSLRHWDDNTQDWAYMRTSDEAAKQVIDNRFAQYEDLLAQYGYNGSTYPKKLRTITETNVPRIKFTEESLASDDGQTNFLMKSAIINKVNDVIQMHVYSIDDLEFEYNIDDEFDCMGFYKKFSGSPTNQVRNNCGIGYKTTGDFITKTTYDPVRTANMNLPAGVKGFAFKKQDGMYLYALWAKTVIDNSEYANKNYSFPSSFNISQVKRYNWDYAQTNQSATISSSGINLNGSPSFFEEIPTGNTRPNVTLSTPNAINNDDFIVKVTFNEPVSGMSINDLVVTNATLSGFSGSGTTYFVTIHPIQSGTIVINLPQGAAVDNGNLPNTAAYPLTTIFKYCQPKGNVTYSWIKSVRLNTLTKYSHKRVYNDFTEFNYTLNRAASIPVKLNAELKANRNGFFRAWIDYDNDGRYQESEIAFQGKANNQNGNLYTSFHIPTSAKNGKTRMRVMFRLDDYPISPCTTIENGEVEDYSVTIIGNGGQNDCILYVTQHEKICDDMGTPIKGWDDEFSISMTVNGLNASGNWVANINGQTLTGPYNQPVNFGPYVIHDNSFTAEFNDASNTGCEVSTFIVPPSQCSNFSGVGNTNYCMPESNNPWAEWIKHVVFSNINNTSHRKPYSDFSFHEADVTKGSSYPINLTTGFGYYTHPEYWRVWIDYNQNEVFESSEMVFQKMASAPANGTPESHVNGNITIPSYAKNGSTIMRVIMSRTGYAQPCDNIQFGEIEDYSVNIQSGSTAQVPACTQVTSPTNNATEVPLDAPIVWASVPNATGYKITVSTVPNGHNILNEFEMGNVTSLQLSGFQNSTTYYVKILPYNATGVNTSCTYSSFTTVASSTGGETMPTCTQVTSPTNNATEVPLDAPIVWASVPNATGYKITVSTVPNGHDILNEFEMGNVTSLQLSGFQNSTTYYVKILPYNTVGMNTSCTYSSFTTVAGSTGGGGGGGVNPDCLDNADGYTFLGTFEGHNYFSSQTALSWPQAQTAAESIGGHLVDINTAQENQFLTNLISEISYIGLNDAASEGNFVWTDNSAPSYTNLSNCSWCSANSNDYDYYTIFPWDGTWNLDHRWTPRKYIVEINCGENTPTCNLQATANNVTCADNHTPSNPNDDVFNFDLNVSGVSNWTASFNGITQSGSGSYSSFGPYGINQGTPPFTSNQAVTITVTDADDASCFTTTQIVVPNPCSDGGSSGGVDLALSLAATPINPGQWNQVTTSLTISNTGSATAHNVVVHFFKQSDNNNWSKLGYMNDNTPAGTDFHDWPGVWEIPSIAPNGSYTLEYTGFTKVGSPIPMFAQVITCDEQDNDSSPNNNTSQNPTEDDEALIVLNQASGSFVQQNTIPQWTTEGLNIFPNPAKNTITVSLPTNQAANLKIVNNLGQVVYTKHVGADHEPFIQVSLTQIPTGTYSVFVNEMVKRLVIHR